MFLLFIAAISTVACMPPPEGSGNPKATLKPDPFNAEQKSKVTLEPTPFSVLSCGTHELSVGTYTIESPNHPSNYGNNVDCSYILAQAAGVGSLSVSCSAFDIEANSRCVYDYLLVNGQRYCGTSGPAAVSSSRGMLVDFHSDHSVVKTGYRCTVTATAGSAPSVSGNLACGAYSLGVGTYTIKSINHPGNYNNNYDCAYGFAGKSDVAKLKISCSAFLLESHSSCRYDFLSVNGVKFCGSSGPQVSSTSSLAVIFHTDFSVVKTGFSCTVEAEASGGGGGGGGGGGNSCSCGVPNRSTRVVGGVETEVNEYPWQAGLVSPGQTRTWCGGILINDLYVLTAAHCTSSSASQIQVLLGDHRISVSDGESRHTLSQIIQHPQYTGNVASGNDFSLLKLSSAVTFSSKVRPACMPTASNMFDDATAIATGFGRIGATRPQATTLQEVEVQVWSQSRCSSKWSVQPTTICAGGSPQGGKSVCMGDSGGPLVTLENSKYSVIGVVSYGRACAYPNTPDVYGRVTAVLPWIRANTAGANWCT